MKNKEFVSRIVNGLRALNKDAHISKRYILGIGRTKAKFLMSQKYDELTLYKEDNIVSVVKCFELKKIDAVRCDIVEFRTCNVLMKSKEKLPDVVTGKLGTGILSVTTIDGNEFFDYLTPNKLANNRKRKYADKVNQKFYYVRDGYLYLANSEIEAVDVSLFATDPLEVESASGCSDCPECMSAWEKEFVCPDRFLDLVQRETLQEIAGVRENIAPDENPNWDLNQKSQTTP